MFRFSLRAALGLMLVTAIVCTVLFALPEHVFVAVLLVGVIAIPGPLAVGIRHERRWFRVFTRGGLIAYGVWLAIIGIPCGYQAMGQFGGYIGVPLSGVRTTMGGIGFGTAVMVVPNYILWTCLYVPWFAVPCAGLLAVIADFIVREPPQTERQTAQTI